MIFKKFCKYSTLLNSEPSGDNKNLKLIKSSYFYNNFVDLKRKHKSIIQQSKVIYYLTFNNDLKYAQKNPKLHYKQTVIPLKCILNILKKECAL